MVYNLRNRNVLVTGGSRYEFEDVSQLTNYSIYIDEAYLLLTFNLLEV
jgi:hypothetical protein